MADAYIERLGSIDFVEEADKSFISAGFNGADDVLDVGCGPGHLTAYLNSLGHQAAGIDLVPEFVNHARSAYPGIDFSVTDIANLSGEIKRVGGVLAWYSLIHMSPGEMAKALQRISEILTTEGALIYGGFLAPSRTVFDHRVTAATAYSEEEIKRLIEEAGFRVRRLETRPATETNRAHIAVAAVRSEGRMETFSQNLCPSKNGNQMVTCSHGSDD